MTRIHLSDIAGTRFASFTVDKPNAAQIEPRHYVGMAWRIKDWFKWPNWKFVKAEDV